MKINLLRFFPAIGQVLREILYDTGEPEQDLTTIDIPARWVDKLPAIEWVLQILRNQHILSRYENDLLAVVTGDEEINQNLLAPFGATGKLTDQFLNDLFNDWADEDR